LFIKSKMINFAIMVRKKRYKVHAIEIPISFAISILLVFYFVWHLPEESLERHPKPQTQSAIAPTDTIVKSDTLIDVSGKKVLFVGDSHTVYAHGWQDQLAKKTGMTYINTAQGGRRTDWMIQAAQRRIDSTYDYCFIWGGANDMASQVTIKQATLNIQAIVDMCNSHGIKPIVLTGFDPKLCIKVSGMGEAWQPYPSKYTEFQKQLPSNIKNAVVITNHFISRQDGDCSDFICHMSASGHRKMANGIISYLKFKVVN